MLILTIGVDAPKNNSVHREEIYERILQQQNQAEKVVTVGRCG